MAGTTLAVQLDLMDRYLCSSAVCSGRKSRAGRRSLQAGSDQAERELFCVIFLYFLQLNK